MNVLKTSFAALCLIILFSCGEGKKEAENPALDSTTTESVEKSQSTQSKQMLRVMAVHDELMPKMSVIGRLANRVNNSTEEGNFDAEKQEIIEELQGANKSMMRWMANFGKDFSTAEIMEGAELSPAKQKALDRHEKSVLELKAKMEGVIAKAEAILEK